MTHDWSKPRLSLVADGNTTGTGPGDPWTGSGGGVQPPYSGYAPSHLAQPAYPMHLPHDPMVSDFSSLPFSRFYPDYPLAAAEPEETINHAWLG